MKILQSFPSSLLFKLTDADEVDKDTFSSSLNFSSRLIVASPYLGFHRCHFTDPRSGCKFSPLRLLVCFNLPKNEVDFLPFIDGA